MLDRRRPTSGLIPCGFGASRTGVDLFRDARAPIVMAPTSDVAYEFIGRALCGLEVF